VANLHPTDLKHKIPIRRKWVSPGSITSTLVPQYVVECNALLLCLVKYQSLNLAVLSHLLLDAVVSLFCTFNQKQAIFPVRCYANAVLLSSSVGLFVFPPVCYKPVLSQRLDELSRFLAWRLYSIYPTLCCCEICESPKIRVLPSESIPDSEVEKFCHVVSMALSVKLVFV